MTGFAVPPGSLYILLWMANSVNSKDFVMLTNKIVGHSSNDAVVRDIMDRIADAIQGDSVLVSMTEYAHSFRIDGKRHATGMRTFIININDGDPDLSVEYTGASCCD